MKYLLHIDTSGDTGTVAIACNGELVCSCTNTETRNQAGRINIMIADMALEAGIELSDLAAVAVCAGPGSYTGLRIGLATAKGLCYALGIPLLMQNKLTLLAYQAYRKSGNEYKYYIPVLLARENEYFISVFDNAFVNIHEATHVIGDEIDNILAGKEAICIISEHLGDENHQKYAKNAYVDQEVNIALPFWFFYAFEEFKCNRTVNLSTAEPFYLKQVYTHK